MHGPITNIHIPHRRHVIDPPLLSQACLILVEKRETRYRVQWYYRLFEETQKGLLRHNGQVEVIHGSLMALGELLRHTGMTLNLSTIDLFCQLS